jgi:hypothetical protein
LSLSFRAQKWALDECLQNRPKSIARKPAALARLALGATSQIVQAALLDVAARYDGLAHQAETLAALNSPEFDP